MSGYGNDIIYADQPGSDALVNSPVVSQTSKNSESTCPCGLCPSQSTSNISRISHSGVLSDLQQSVSASNKKCSCNGCSKGNSNNLQHRNINANETIKESPSSGVVFCDCCKKQKISVSNFRALQIANRLHLADQGSKNSGHPNNNSYFEDDLCKRIDLSLNMDVDIDTKMKSAFSLAGLPGTNDSNNKHNVKTHGRHSSDSVFDHNRSNQSFDSIANHANNHMDNDSGGIDLSQFCVCELNESNTETRRKTSSSVDEIFNLSGTDGNTRISRNSNPVELHGRERERLDGSSQRQRSLSDSQRDKAKVDNSSKFNHSCNTFHFVCVI